MARIPFQQAEFLCSAERLSQCPADDGLEVAFAGRSNAGKSSALNTITQQRKLARTSKTPGRTQLINFFSLTEEYRLVDLPGYGYAKVPQSMRETWQKHLDQYLRERQALCGLVLMMDIRRPFTDFDVAMLDWGDAAQLPVHILLTKADKLKKGGAKNTLLAVQRELEQYPNSSAQLFSSLKHTGVEEARLKITEWLLPEWENPPAR